MTGTFEERIPLPETVQVLLSSTLADLVQVRESVGDALQETGMVDLVGMAPGRTASSSSSSYLLTTQLAESCDLYVLILGQRYGFETDLGKSATELEYETAYRDDPTKVLVLRRADVTPEPRQAEFIRRVEDYHHGYFVSRFERPEEAGNVAASAFRSWLIERAAVGRKLDFFDHFLRLAVQRTPMPGARCEYAVNGDTVELTYTVLGRIYSVHIDKAEIYDDFWGSILHLDQRFQTWREEKFGRR